MRKRKRFITRSLAATGRRSTILDQKVHTRYKGGGFEVSYRSLPAGRRQPERVEVTVEMEGHGTKSWITAAGIAPTPEMARIHAATMFRTHCKTNHDPADLDANETARVVAGCDC